MTQNLNKVALESGDIEIGAVEIKDATSDTRAAVSTNGLAVDVKAMPAITGTVSVSTMPAITGTVSVSTMPAITGTVNIGTIPAITGTVSVNSMPAMTGTVSISSMPAITGTVDISTIPSITGTVSVSSIPSITGTVSISTMPAITGTVSVSSIPAITGTVSVSSMPTITGTVDVATIPAITGTVTANAGNNLNTSALALDTTLTAIKDTSGIKKITDTVVITLTPVKSVAAITDWTAVAQNTVGESAELDCSGNIATLLTIQAALDTTTAHTGTRFIVQVSSTTSGDEDWYDYTEFIGLFGTAKTDLIENNPLAALSISITLTAHLLTVLGKWLLIKDGVSLADSELVFEVAKATNTITILDGTTNAHAVNTAIFDIAISQVVLLDPSVYRVRVLVDNTYDSDGSTLNYKLRCSKATLL